MESRDYLGRTPFPSLIATVICCGGVGLFCATLFRALEITLRGIFEGLFNIHVSWLQSIQISFIIVAVVMGIFSILLLVFGFLATGATRENIYSGAKCIMGGRISAGVFLGVTYLFNCVWLGVSSFCCLPILIYVMLNSICIMEIENRGGGIAWTYDSYCLNLSRFGIYINETDGRKNALCEMSELSDFCKHVKDVGPLYSMAFAGSLIIVLALVAFVIILGANYQRIKFSRELTEYRTAVDIELNDSKILTNPRIRQPYSIT